MPLYEYECKKCGKVSEFLIGVGKEESLKCKKCGAADLEKMISSPNVGSGKPQSAGCDASNSCGNPHRCCPGGACHH